MESKELLFPNLRAEMIRHGNTQTILMKLLGISRTAISARFNGKSEFTKREIDIILNYYKKKYEELFK